MGYLDGFGVIIKKWFGVNTDSGARVTLQYPEEVRPKPERFHGRHVLNRYEDGMEKCIGCELCAGVCPAKCIYVRGKDNDPEDPTSPGERFGFVYEINYLRCIHCDLCVEACPTEAITETKLFEFSFTNREDAIYTKNELLVGDDGRPQQLPWENWDGGFDPARDTSGWMRATAPQGDSNFKGLIAWAGELGYGVRPPERAKVLEETGPVPSVAHGHHDAHDDHIASEPDDGAGVDAVEPQIINVPMLDQAARFDAGDVTSGAAATYGAAGEYDADALVGEEVSYESAARFDATEEESSKPAWFSPGESAGDEPFPGQVEPKNFDAVTEGRKGRRGGRHAAQPSSPEPDEIESEAPLQGTEPDLSESSTTDAWAAPGEPAVDLPSWESPPIEMGPVSTGAEVGPTGSDQAEPGAEEAIVDEAGQIGSPDTGLFDESTEEPTEHISRKAGHFDVPDVDEPEPKKKRRFRK